MEALGLQQHGRSDAGGEGADDLEVGLAEGSGADRLTDEVVLQAFVCIGVEVHPFRVSHVDASLALRWAADSFANLRDQGQRQGAAASAVYQAPLRDQVCATSADEALRLFGEAVTALHNRLSLHDLARGGVSRAAADALLHGMHLLHLRPHLRDRPNSEERVLLDSVLSGALTANWLLSTFCSFVSFRPNALRYQREIICSTTVAALGGVAFTGAARLQRMLTDAGDGRSRLGDEEATLEPLVRCPLCRECTPAARAIQNVRAGDAAPTCCVCTEQRASVCLVCGHLCLCEECYLQLPRTTEAAG